MSGVNCDKCGYRIYPNEQMLIYSTSRKDDNYYFHYSCFFEPLAERISNCVMKELKEKRELVVMALFQDKIK